MLLSDETCSPTLLRCFAHVARGSRFRTRELHQRAAEALGSTTDTYHLGQLRYDLAKLRAEGVVVQVPKTQTYRLTSPGFRICVVFLKLAHRVMRSMHSTLTSPLDVLHDTPRIIEL